MEYQTKRDPFDAPAMPDGPLEADRERSARAQHTFWSVLGTWYRWRRFILGVTAAMAVAAVVISLLLPNWYRASTRLLPPQRSSINPLAAALGKDLASAATAILSGGSGDYARYLTILTSRTLMETVVDTFDLVHVYEVEDDEAPRSKALALLEDNVDFLLDKEYDYLSVDVLDKDRQRAANMANFFVQELNRVNNRLSSQAAHSYRRFVEQRYEEAQAALDSVLNATEAFQKAYGVFDLPTQAEGFFEQLGELRAQGIQAEVQFEALRDQLGPDNLQVRQLGDIARAANRKYQNALEGQEKLLPVAKEAFPAVARQYLNLERERLIQTRILEIVGPMYEQARFEEEREVQAVQIVDQAVPPVKKAKPKRSVIVIAATLSALILALLYTVLYEWWQRNHRHFAYRLQKAATDRPPLPARKP